MTPRAGVFLWLEGRRGRRTRRRDDDDPTDDRRRDGRPGAARPGRRHGVRLSRRRGAADLRRAVPAERHPPHPRAPRAGRRPRRRGLRPLDRQARRRPRHLRPRRHQRRHRHDRRADGLDPDRRADRPGPDLHDRQRRLPGGRHRRHHPALHQAQLAGQGHRRSSPRPSTRRSTSRPTAAPARCSSTSRRTSSSPPRPTLPPAEARVSHYQPRTKGDPDAILAAVEALEKAERPILYSGGGVINSGPEATRLLRALAEATGFPLTSTLMGLGAYPAERPVVDRHARHARHLRGQLGDARLRRHALHRRPLRRPHHRPARRLLARLASRIHIDIDPSSINKNIHVQVPIVGDVAAVLGDMLALWQARGSKTALRRGRQVVEADRALARPQLPRLPELGDDDQAAARAPAAGGADRAAATATSPPRSASTRCGRRST